MTKILASIFESFQRPATHSDEEPIRQELYSIERLEQYAAILAAKHTVSTEPQRGRSLLPRLEENGRKLILAYRALADAVRNERTISPAAEWLVDNFHIVEEQLRQIREDLPKSYYRELPKLEEADELAGYPRIYAVAVALISHTDSRLDAETLKRFIQAYQRGSMLSIGELWAVAITLRLTLVENLRRLATRIISAREEREEADTLADKFLELAGKQPEAIMGLLAERSNARERLGRAFVVQLTQRLRDQDPAVMPVLDWMERQLAKQGKTTEQIVQQEHQRQAAAQVTVGNIITSMRLLSTLDWREFFESVSLVDPVLSEDPAGAYAQMNFATRDRYRHVVERISKRTEATELEVAKRALQLASTAAQQGQQSDLGDDARRHHIGYYLIDDGLAALHKAFGYRPHFREQMLSLAKRHPTFAYLGTLTLLTALIVAALAFYALASGAGLLMLAVVMVLAVVPASDLALSVLNWDITSAFKPHPLPKMDASAGIPEDARTMVVVPTLFTSEAAVQEMLERLEVRFLANQDKHLYFALLSDFADAPEEEMPEDTPLLEAALSGIQALNKRYSPGGNAANNAANNAASNDIDSDADNRIGSDGGSSSGGGGSDRNLTTRFHLFHRRRQWNESEEKWIGWERKRGKLHEFNRLLRGAHNTSFVVNTASQNLLSQIRYIITLDSDTQLPRDAARRLVGIILHPLNQPRFNSQVNRVTAGYAVLQPRVSVSLESASGSRFARIFSGHTGIDPYTAAVSDVYQDLFGEGSFTGKGLYDVDAFEAALNSRVPENSLLSHDLFEGLFARAALVTDIELLDDYPAHYDTHAKRQHRWTRGDWQIGRWLLPVVPDAHGGRVRNTLPLISCWKIADNLRRSLVAPVMLAWLVAAWTVLPGQPLWWTLFALSTLAFPVYAHLTTSLLLHPRGTPWTSHFWNVWGDLRTNTVQVGLTVIFLAHQAYLMVDAIARTLYRKFFSHKYLLEWTTAAQAASGSSHDRQAFWRFMWPAELITLVVLLIVVLYGRPAAIIVASPFLLLWALSPLIAHWISAPANVKDQQPLAAKDVVTVRLLARRTWRFFETFVGQEDNWLPPDNFQEDPRPVIAHRTSPTNIGLLLLSTVAARDFGYTGALETVERLELTFNTLSKLERFRGHLLNWYDTHTLEPLMPQYVSTVDSGNLAGHLIATKQTCIEFGDQPLFDRRVIDGLTDTIVLLRDEVTRLGAVRQQAQVVPVKQLRKEIDACVKLVSAAAPETLSQWTSLCESLTERTPVIEDIVLALSQEYGGGFDELRFWLSALKHQTHVLHRDLVTFTPWAASPTAHLAPIITSCSAETAQQWQQITLSLDRVPTVSQIPEVCEAALAQLARLRQEIEQHSLSLSSEQRLVSDGVAAVNGLTMLTSTIESGASAATGVLTRLTQLAQSSDKHVEEMDFGFLFDEERKVFAIGYNITDGRRDNSYYDLLASESRLASFVAVAKGDAPQEHWFRLGRQLTPVDSSRALISWTATMFEYLMPLLVMRRYADTLLDQTYKAVVARQIKYGRERAVPWGISESAYNARDLQLTYQYGPFGVPGLGLKRGLSEDLVVSPYSTLLALMIDPPAALENIHRLTREGALARYGFYEAIDYTPERLPQNQKQAFIHCFMAHHQGMSLVALGNLLHNGVMQRRFHAEPLMQATELLLQERIPRNVLIARPRAEEVLSGRVVRTLTAPVTRRYESGDLPTPRTQLLSNGTYSVMLTTAGGGYSMCGSRAVTRWREDATRDNWGTFCYLRDVRSGAVWSAGYQPTGRAAQHYEVSFSEDKVEFSRHDAGIVTHTEIIVSPEDNAEVRRVSLTNLSSRTREIELTSYAEIVLAPPAADAAHPAFSSLFIETEFIHGQNTLLARRRKRSEKDELVWGVHTVVTEGEKVGAIQYETDRGRFLGRGHAPAAPVAVIEDRPLSNTVGAVLDPVFSMRQRVRIPPQKTVRISFTTGVAHSHEEALGLAVKYRDTSIFEREARLAWTKSQVEMRHINIDAEEAHLFQRLAGRVLYSDPSLRPRPHVLGLNTKTQSSLWPYGISGDLPIVLIRISQAEDINMVRQMLRGHEYLRLKGLAIDLVILNDHPPTYAQSLHDALQNLIRSSGLQNLQDKPGGIFLRRTDIMPEADRILLHTVARVGIVADRGSLEDQLSRRPVEGDLPAALVPRWPSRTYPEPSADIPNLSFFNGLGGFSDGGREYVIVLGEGQATPAPWSNVVANEQDFGFLVTEMGSGYTWSANSRENRLTPWSNDAISDPPGEIIYLRDEDTGTVWTTTPLPVREAEPYVIRHGQGYTNFQHTSHGIGQELRLFVSLDDSVKFSVLRLHNRTDRRRRLSVTSYNELVLGVSRERAAPFVITEIDSATGAILARNAYNNEFASRVMFADISEHKRTVTCDRKEFLGRNNSPSHPAALGRTRLSGRTGAGLDPCAAMQTYIELAPGETHEVAVLIGEADSAEQAREIVTRYGTLSAINAAFERVIGYWNTALSTVEVHTPDQALDTMLNRWLLYQNLACRVWARSAFYQSGGAYGFRDQLQDVMSLAYSRPEIARAQIVRAAGRQFKEGDVQHWWHPPTGRGVRTRFSDDLLWLPYVTAFYINVTGDVSVLDEQVPFIETPVLTEGEDEVYTQPVVSDEAASVYEHCVRTLDRSLATGEHGLPLMGSGDWNDGMNRVGNLGRGESVWVGWFLSTTLQSFIPFCDKRGEQGSRSLRYRQHMGDLKKALEENAWDGDWYRRAYFDDGTPLGSAQNEECRIDSIAQSWGVISGVADPQRAARAMASVEEYLIQRGEGLVLLFTPPFDRSHLDPGYIKGYVPGVRENGGQYTHAAIWTMIAYAMLGDGDRAGELFSLLNPINHASTRAGLHKYKVEPYVAAGDVYAVWPHTGRGGWTWYTGSAGWMYRAGLEFILGFKLRDGERLQIDPCIPRSWREYEILYRHGSSQYLIKIENPHGVNRGVIQVEMDGVPLQELEIPLTTEGGTHHVRIVLGEKPSPSSLPPPPQPDTPSHVEETQQEQTYSD